MIVASDIHLFTRTCTNGNQNTLRMYQANILNLYPYLFFSYNTSTLLKSHLLPVFPNQTNFFTWWWSVRFFKHNSLGDVMFKSDDKFFWSAECSLLVCFWSFDEEIKLWVKACRRWISHWSSYESSSIRTSFMSIVLW